MMEYQVYELITALKNAIIEHEERIAHLEEKLGMRKPTEPKQQ